MKKNKIKWIDYGETNVNIPRVLLVVRAVLYLLLRSRSGVRIPCPAFLKNIFFSKIFNQTYLKHENKHFSKLQLFMELSE